MSVCHPSQAYEIVRRLKSDGTFDFFRKECLADIDTRPAYNNLKSRVASYVKEILSRQSWHPEMKRHELQEGLRLQIIENGMLTSGVEQIINRVLPKMESIIRPCIERAVSDYLGISPEIDFSEDVKLNADGQIFAEFPPFTYDPHILEESDDDVENMKQYTDFLRETDSLNSFCNDIRHSNVISTKKPYAGDQQNYTNSSVDDFEHCSNESAITEKYDNGQSSESTSPQSCMSALSNSRHNNFIYGSPFNDVLQPFDSPSTSGTASAETVTKSLADTDLDYTNFPVPTSKSEAIKADNTEIQKIVLRENSNKTLYCKSKDLCKVNDPLKAVKTPKKPCEDPMKLSPIKDKINQENQLVARQLHKSGKNVLPAITHVRSSTVKNELSVKNDSKPTTSPKDNQRIVKCSKTNKDALKRLKAINCNRLNGVAAQRLLHSKHKSKARFDSKFASKSRNEKLGDKCVIGENKKAITEQEKRSPAKSQNQRNGQFEKTTSVDTTNDNKVVETKRIENENMDNSEKKDLVGMKSLNKASGRKLCQQSAEMKSFDSEIDSSEVKIRPRENSTSQHSNAESTGYCLTDSSDVDDYEIVKSNEVTKIRLKLLKSQRKFSACAEDELGPARLDANELASSSDDEPLSALKIKKTHLPSALNVTKSLSPAAVEVAALPEPPTAETCGRFLRTRQITKNRRYYGSDYSNFSSDSSDDVPKTKANRAQGTSVLRKSDTGSFFFSRIKAKKMSAENNNKKACADKNSNYSSDEETLSTLRARSKNVSSHSNKDSLLGSSNCSVQSVCKRSSHNSGERTLEQNLPSRTTSSEHTQACSKTKALIATSNGLAAGHTQLPNETAGKSIAEIAKSQERLNKHSFSLFQNSVNSQKHILEGFTCSAESCQKQEISSVSNEFANNKYNACMESTDNSSQTVSSIQLSDDDSVEPLDLRGRESRDSKGSSDDDELEICNSKETKYTKSVFNDDSRMDTSSNCENITCLSNSFHEQTLFSDNKSENIMSMNRSYTTMINMRNSPGLFDFKVGENTTLQNKPRENTSNASEVDELSVTDNNVNPLSLTTSDADSFSCEVICCTEAGDGIQTKRADDDDDTNDVIEKQDQSYKNENRCLRSKSSNSQDHQSSNEKTRRLRNRRSALHSTTEIMRKRCERHDSAKSKDHNRQNVRSKNFVTELYWKPVIDYRTAKRKGTFSEDGPNKKKK